MIEILDSELRPASHLIVAFTGVSHRLGGLDFEFYKSLRGIDCAPLFVRDSKVRWYQYDRPIVAGIASQIQGAALRVGARRIVCLGNSMGGFGALLFGSLCHAAAILAFVPQSGISPEVMSELDDPRFGPERAAIAEYPCGDLLNEARPTGHVVVCCGSGDIHDLRHAERIAAAWPCEKIVVPDCHHSAAQKLKERGELLPLIERVARAGVS